jgi:hypothetical protein
MIRCDKCPGRVFIDRTYSSPMHLETYCILCGTRKFYSPPDKTTEGRWLLKKEVLRAKATISSL